MLTVLFGPAFQPLVRVTAAALGPSLRALPLDLAQVKVVAKKVAVVLGGGTATYEALGAYTAAEVKEMAEGLTEILRVVLAHYELALPEAELARLLDAVAEKAVPAAPVAA